MKIDELIKDVDQVFDNLHESTGRQPKLVIYISIKYYGEMIEEIAMLSHEIGFDYHEFSNNDKIKGFRVYRAIDSQDRTGALVHPDYLICQVHEPRF